MDEKIIEISKRRGFTSFWECLDYMLLVNYDEIEALMTSSELFDGNIWGGVISTTRVRVEELPINIGTGSTEFYIDKGEDDDLLVKMYLITPKGNRNYIPLYKSYIKTKEYGELSEFDGHIKSIIVKLTTNLGIMLYNDGQMFNS